MTTTARLRANQYGFGLHVALSRARQATVAGLQGNLRAAITAAFITPARPLPWRNNPRIIGAKQEGVAGKR